MPRITADPDIAFDCAPGDTILRAALRAGIGMPYSCNTGSCGNCRFTLLDGNVRHLRQDAPAWGERDLARNRWLGCQSQPQGDCRVKFRAMDQYVPPVRPARRTAELVAAQPLTRDITDFAFRVGGGADFRPGQYALLYIDGIDGPRAYSMSNLPGEDDWRFLIKRTPTGAATNLLFDAAPGLKIEIDGPYGNAWLDTASTRDIVLLAGGSGLSPMVSIARGAAAAGMLQSRQLHVYYGGREEADLCDATVLGPEAAAHATFRAALSEPGPSWDGPQGFLHDVVEAEMGAHLKDCEIYFAGPAVMSAAVQKMAHDNAVPPDQLHFDEFF